MTQTSRNDEALQHAAAALAADRRTHSHVERIRLSFEDDVIVVEGTVNDIAAKRLAPGIVAAAAANRRVLDRLRLERGSCRNDHDLAEAVSKALADEPVFERYRIAAEPAPEAEGRAGEIISVEADDGGICLSGQVGSLSHRRLAEVLAWWVPGVADVDNRLYVSPAERDSDDEITDAIRMVLEKDPWIDPNHVQVRTRDRVVTLAGMLPGDEQKRMAENDVWYIPGVHDVVNNIVSAEWLRMQTRADDASRASFPASDPPAMTAVIGVGGRSVRVEGAGQ